MNFSHSVIFSTEDFHTVKKIVFELIKSETLQHPDILEIEQTNKQSNKIGIKEIKNNPGLPPQAVENNEYLLISKRGKPIAIATALDDEVFDLGLKKWILIQAFKNGSLSLGQLSRSLDKTYTETTELLNVLNIPLLDYDLEDEMDVVDSLS